MFMSFIIDTTTANLACIPIFQRHSIQSAFQCSTQEAATETRTKAIKCHFISLQQQPICNQDMDEVAQKNNQFKHEKMYFVLDYFLA